MPPVQALSPEGHAHVPFVQDPPAAQAVPHVPQLPMLVWRSTQVPLHIESPVAHPVVQTLFTHSSPIMQRLPQPPQLRGSLVGSMHAPPHIVVPVLQVQALDAQVAPVGHAVPHAPQSSGSFVRLTHELEQLVRPDAHVVVQTPAEQTWPVVQAFPQAPQLFTSPEVFVQTPLQRVPPL
jgi:hypothetical protein